MGNIAQQPPQPAQTTPSNGQIIKPTRPTSLKKRWTHMVRGYDKLMATKATLDAQAAESPSEELVTLKAAMTQQLQGNEIVEAFVSVFEKNPGWAVPQTVLENRISGKWETDVKAWKETLPEAYEVEEAMVVVEADGRDDDVEELVVTSGKWDEGVEV
ncbi:hypothetical protein SLS59_008674 [Nothophoma quercina]|uniref:Uncharacterized protein n=1 Tax=Nothophoma quercina TaxID=749835 RepID=A0ABR3QRS2_9PLEO